MLYSLPRNLMILVVAAVAAAATALIDRLVLSISDQQLLTVSQSLRDKLENKLVTSSSRVSLTAMSSSVHRVVSAQVVQT